MQCEFLAFHSVTVEVCEHLRCEVESRCWCSHTSFYFRIYGLIGSFVAFLCFSVEIRRYREFASHIEYICKVYICIVPFEIHPLTRTVFAFSRGFDGEGMLLDRDGSAECSLFPFLEISHEAEPTAFFVGLEHLFIVCRFCRFEQKHFNECSCFLSEM